jgi:hypothetical protein
MVERNKHFIFENQYKIMPKSVFITAFSVSDMRNVVITYGKY